MYFRVVITNDPLLLQRADGENLAKMTLKRAVSKPLTFVYNCYLHVRETTEGEYTLNHMEYGFYSVDELYHELA